MRVDSDKSVAVFVLQADRLRLMLPDKCIFICDTTCRFSQEHVNVLLLAEDAKFEAVTRERLCGEKLYIKLLRKQQKDMEMMKKRHQKERALMQRAHCTVVDKLVATHDKEKMATEKYVEKKLKKNRYM